MTDLTTAQIEKIRNAVNGGNERYQFMFAAATDRDRKLAVVTVFANDGELHVATVKTDRAPNWLSNDAQFDEVVDDAVKKLARPGFR